MNRWNHPVGMFQRVTSWNSPSDDRKARIRGVVES